IDCIKVNYDITKPQPQLFYVNDFVQLESVIDELAATMAYKLGGAKGLERAKQARTVTTTVLDSGLQISGVLSDIRLGKNAEHKDSGEDFASYAVEFLKYDGPSQLSYKDVELPHQGIKQHPHGFSTPLGEIVGLNKDASYLTDEYLERLGYIGHIEGIIAFVSGIVLIGRLYYVICRDCRTKLHNF